MIELKNVVIEFNGKKLLNRLSFRIEKGEHLCISGASGTGKSTLLKLLQGYVLPSEGEVMINNLVISRETIHKIRNAMVYIPQNVNLPVHDGKELADWLFAGEKLSEIQTNMERLGLPASQLNQSFDQISGGEKQRMIVAICLALNKSIILLDEPTSSLDDNSIEKLIDLLSSQKENTIISTSHNKKWISFADKQLSL
jgi:polar amino acid transport system ATP-binding protein/putative ABC transport system ATP-binding protein